jgi:VCBS repeat-containing protein
VNGKTYEFSLPGGGFMSFEALLEVLGVAQDPDAEASENETAAADVLTINDIEISDETKEFVADVENVEFSKPELVWVGKVDEDSAVGSLKEANGLECQYSAKLTAEQIAEINAQTAKAGDWALISVQPFLSHEALTVTMKTGEVFTIQVTDGQLHTYAISAAGDKYEIIVTYDDTAGIPEDAKLEVGSVKKRRQDLSYEIKGKHMLSGLPVRLEITANETVEAFEEPTNQIIAQITGILETAPPELVSDVSKEGILLSGGGSLLYGMARLIQEKTGVKVMPSDEPENVVAAGAGMAGEYIMIQDEEKREK